MQSPIAVNTRAQHQNLVQLALRDMPRADAIARRRMASRQNELERIKLALLDIFAAGVHAEPHSVAALEPRGQGEIMLCVDAPEHHRLALIHAISDGRLDFTFLAGEHRPHSVLSHPDGWILFITWTSHPVLMEVAA